MIDVNDLRKGTTFTMDGELYKVLQYQFHKPGRGNAFIRTTLRNLRSGSTIQHTFASGERVQDIRVERRGVQYLYTDGDLYHFMDTETYDQTALPAAMLDDQALYLKEGIEQVLATYEGEPLDVDLPTTVDMKVVEAEIQVAGDSATGTLKKVSLETGLQVQVPLFVEVGDVVRVDTRTGTYVTRV
jgi:elongation factor P